MNKPKLNEPDVEISLTTPQGESINKTIPNKEFEDYIKPIKNICEARPPIEWYEKELKDRRKEIDKLYVENKQLKDAIIYLVLKEKENNLGGL